MTDKTNDPWPWGIKDGPEDVWIEKAPTNGDPEKSWWRSKKFFAFLLCEIGFFLLMGGMIYEQEMDKIGENLAFMVLAITAGFGMVGYCLGQSFIDRYVRVATIVAGRPANGSEGKT